MGEISTDVGEEYYKWVMSFADKLNVFATLTFTRPHSYHWAYDKSVRMWRFTNEHVHGKRFRERDNFLTTVFVVETKHAKPHVHFLQESHPSLTPETYLNLWRKANRGWVSANAIKVEKVKSKKAVVRYILKRVKGGSLPFVSPPPEYQIPQGG